RRAVDLCDHEVPLRAVAPVVADRGAVERAAICPGRTGQGRDAERGDPHGQKPGREEGTDPHETDSSSPWNEGSVSRSLLDGLRAQVRPPDHCTRSLADDYDGRRGVG